MTHEFEYLMPCCSISNARSVEPGFSSGRYRFLLLSGVGGVMELPVRFVATSVMAEEIRSALAAADQLRSALDSRTVIDVACGVIMARNRCSCKDAFEVLLKASDQGSMTLREMAGNVLASLPAGSPETYFQR